MPDEENSDGGVPRYRNGYTGAPPKARRKTLPAVGADPFVADDGSLAVLSPDLSADLFETPLAEAPVEDEVTRLKRTIAEKDRAILRSAITLKELQQQLAEEKDEANSLRTAITALKVDETNQAQAESSMGLAPLTADGRIRHSPETQRELDKQRKEWAKIQRALEAQTNQRKSELAAIRSQWYQTQQQLETETKARRMESAQSSATITKLSRELDTAKEVIVKVQNSRHGMSKGVRATLAAVSVIVLLAGGLIRMQISAQSSGAAKPAAEQSGPAAVAAKPVADTRIVRTLPAVSAPVDRTVEQQHFVTGSQALRPGYTMSNKPIFVPQVTRAAAGSFQGSLANLNRALSAFGNQPVEEVLRDVRRRAGDNTVCAFRWNDGQPALLYGGDTGKVNLSGVIARCAMAVEQAAR